MWSSPRKVSAAMMYAWRQRDDSTVVAKMLLLDPPAVLGELCRRLGIEFDPAMLSWPAGPKPEDGVWAPHWYEAVHRSNGWGQWKPKTLGLRAHLEPVLEQAQELYDALVPYMITSD